MVLSQSEIDGMRDKRGITDSAKVFHSFRHTFKRMTRAAS
jgi:hypothetical protein